MSQNVIWECPACNEQTRFKGLCRECTEYEDGKPVKPVHRIRLNHNPSQKHTHKRTRSDYLNQRRPHPSKKQLDAMKEMLNSASKVVDSQGHTCSDESCCPPEEDFTPIGEAIKDIGEEE